MAEKTGGGDRLQAYDPETGKYIALGENSTIKRENKSVVLNGKTFDYDDFARFAKEVDFILGDNNFKYWANGDFDKEDRVAYENYLTELWNEAEEKNENQNIPTNELFAKRAKENIDKLVTKEFIDNLLEKEIEYKDFFEDNYMSYPDYRHVYRKIGGERSSTSFLCAVFLDAKYGSKLKTTDNDEFEKIIKTGVYDADSGEVSKKNVKIFEHIKNKEFIATYRGESSASFQNWEYYSGVNRNNIEGLAALSGGGYYGSGLYTSMSYSYSAFYSTKGKNRFVLDLRGANILIFTKNETEYGIDSGVGICPEIERFRREEKYSLLQQFETKLLDNNVPVENVKKLKAEFRSNIEHDDAFCGLLMGADFIVGDSNQIDIINYDRARVVKNNVKQ
mgnify:CR=1 FL=1